VLAINAIASAGDALKLSPTDEAADRGFYPLTAMLRAAGDPTSLFQACLDIPRVPYSGRLLGDECTDRSNPGRPHRVCHRHLYPELRRPFEQLALEHLGLCSGLDLTRTRKRSTLAQLVQLRWEIGCHSRDDRLVLVLGIAWIGSPRAPQFLPAYLS